MLPFVFAYNCYDDWCKPSMLGNTLCDYSCMTLECGWDEGDCDDLCECDPSLLGDGKCDSTCDFWRCKFDGGDCSVCKKGCSLSDLGDGKCDDSCNDPLCGFDGGDCSERSAEVYVSSTGEGEGIGSWDHPFLSVSKALTFSANKRLRVWLLEGSHSLTPLEPSIILDRTSVTQAYQAPAELIIETLYCGTSEHPLCASNKAELRIGDPSVRIEVDSSLELRSLIVDGTVQLKEGCSLGTCFYCPDVTNGINDRGQPVSPDEYAEQSLCDANKDFSFITVLPSATLKLSNVIVRNFRQQYMSIIESYGANISATDSVFESIQVHGEDANNSVISQRTSAGGAFIFTRVNVLYLNQGYECTGPRSSPSSSEYNLKGFMHLKGAASIHLDYFTAKFNHADYQKLNDSEGPKALIVVESPEACTIENSELVSNIGQNLYLLEAYFREQASQPLFKYEFSIKRTRFSRNYTGFGQLVKVEL
mmetsp:Transcript_529/g.671  ORF Transcript_529/g.671 Transcript_529/m.671 type:complete len:477 (+) Transcript_529:47-1477(+)